MQDYKSFIREAVEQYGKLPQETSELYKHHYVNIPFDLKAFSGNQQDGDPIKSSVNLWASKLGIRFGLALGSLDSIVNNDLVRVERTESLDSSLINSMFKSEEDKYVAYINSNSERSVFVNVPEGKSASINIMLLNSSKPLNARIFINVGDGAKLNVLEYYGSAASMPTSLGVIHEASIGNGSELELNAVHNEDANTLCLGFCKNRIGERSHFRFNSFYNGSSHTRIRNSVRADGNESKVDVNEAIFGSAKQKFDINTYIINAAKHTHASLESKAALMDESFCIMKGFAKILNGAAKARSYVHERGILLDKGAKVDGLPDMSVDENDVKATHSSATAPVDPESVFYLMSKGIGGEGVRKLLVTGFFAESISRIGNPLMREISMSLINSKLAERNYGSMPSMDTRNIWVGLGGAQDAPESDMFKGHYKYRGTE
ncbi:MAG: SufD family Fe-S cluster assembly protein [Candidatus Micrarchaeota archaeon]|nr:SufD family Fe-S cluster assembly protein [Candidatus Micrarchaeota archaeon]